MKNCVFTIVAKNYIGVAQILEQSLKINNPDTDFFIFVADEFDSSFEGQLRENIIISREKLDIAASIWTDMSFKYDLTEFCTAIKPSCYKYLLENTEYEKIIFLDPDIYIFSSFDPIFDMLETHSIVLTPHLSIIRNTYKGEISESGLMGTGVFNLGFCGIRRSLASLKMLDWWHGKLLDKCFIDQYSTYFTDQKWMDFMPCFFSENELLVARHLGMNLAPWNFYERQVVLEGSNYLVKAREEADTDTVPVIFVHYSGYNYKELKKGNVVQNNIKTLNDYTDITLLTDIYSKAIQSNNDAFDRFIELKYSYGKFENGDDIKSFHRRIYRSLTNKGETIAHPFRTDRGSFHAQLHQLGMTNTLVNNVDKITKSTVEGVDSKLVLFNRLMRFVYRVLGFERYLLLIRLFRPFSRYESQIHLFNKQYDRENINF